MRTSRKCKLQTFYPTPSRKVHSFCLSLKRITYKSQLKNRDLNDRHKQELKDLILRERTKLHAPEHQETVQEQETEKSSELRKKGLEMEMEQEYELSDEILGPNKMHRPSESQAKHRKIPLRDLSAHDNSSFYHRQHLSARTMSMSPMTAGVQYIICPLCNK